MWDMDEFVRILGKGKRQRKIDTKREITVCCGSYVAKFLSILPTLVFHFCCMFLGRIVSCLGTMGRRRWEPLILLSKRWEVFEDIIDLLRLILWLSLGEELFMSRWFAEVLGTIALILKRNTSLMLN